jgi:hypothetical protein
MPTEHQFVRKRDINHCCYCSRDADICVHVQYYLKFSDRVGSIS